MKAVYYERKGVAAEVLRFGDMPDPEPGPGEVRVRVAVSGLNPSDTKNRGGWGRYKEMSYPRIIPHNDGAGTIDRLGPGVADRRLGERVWLYEAQRNGRAFGTAAECVVVPSENAVPLPKIADFELGASLGVPAMTAHRCLFSDGGIQGQTVLVQGGAGAVGHMAVQLAGWSGARVIATVSRPEQEAVAQAAGADLVVNRRNEDVAARIREFTAGTGVDRVIEVNFEANLATDQAVLKPNGVIAAYAAGGPESAPPLPFYALMTAGITVHFVLVYAMPREAHWAAAREVNAAIESRALQANIGRRFRLDQVAEAHEAQDSGLVVGKILIDIAAG